MKERHLLALSGGKDSAALAVYMREQYPHLPIEYIFIDTGCELPETYAYLDKLRALLGIEIITIGGKSEKDRKDFLYWLRMKNNYLPSVNKRWCTEILKLLPYSKWIHENCQGVTVHSYVGLRADEKSERIGFVTNGDGLIQHYPFAEDGLIYSDIKQILEDYGIGFPDYYQWRTRSGCYFCFFQTKEEWIGLFKHHPDLFFKSANMEKNDIKTGKIFTWNDDMSLIEILNLYREGHVFGNRPCHEKNINNRLIDTNISCHVSNDLFSYIKEKR